MSTPTEAYYDLRRHVIFSDPDDGAELIANSEARAVAAAVTALTCTHHNDLERAACPVCLVTALTAERDQLRAALALGQQNCDDAYDDLRAERAAAIARAESAEREAFDWTKIARYETARAERAEAELAFQVARNSDLFTQRDQIRAELDAERARLDWLESPAGMDWQWQAGITRATIDAKMQKDAK